MRCSPNHRPRPLQATFHNSQGLLRKRALAEIITGAAGDLVAVQEDDLVAADAVVD